MIDINKKKVMITGGTGMLGRSICKILINRGADIITFSKKQYNLCLQADTEKIFNQTKPDLLLNLCGFNGGLIFNQKYPADIFYQNTLMALNVLETARQYNIQKVLSTLTSCAYPGNSPEVLKEENFYDGPCHPTVECHGLAKRNIEAYSRFLNQQYNYTSPANASGKEKEYKGSQFFTVAITNLYGPWDRFSERGKVVSNLIRKFTEAKEKNLPQIEMMGTGIALRDLLYVEDAAELVVRALERYEDGNFPLNIGSGSEISIKELAETIAEIIGFAGEIVWTGGPDGQLRKLLDVTRMKSILEYEPTVSLKDGLKKTIDWYVSDGKIKG